MHRIIPPVLILRASLWSIIPDEVIIIKVEELIDVFRTFKAFNVIVCFFDGVETSLSVLKKDVFLKKLRFITICVVCGLRFGEEALKTIE